MLCHTRDKKQGRESKYKGVAENVRKRDRIGEREFQSRPSLRTGDVPWEA